MRIGSKIKFYWGGDDNIDYGTIEGTSNNIATKGEWIILFIEGFRASRSKKYCIEVSRLEELLYF